MAWSYGKYTYYCSQKETNDKEMQLGMYHNQYLFISYEYLNLSAIQNNIPIVRAIISIQLPHLHQS